MPRVLVSELTDDWPSVLRFLTKEGLPGKMERDAISALVLLARRHGQPTGGGPIIDAPT